MPDGNLSNKMQLGAALAALVDIVNGLATILSLMSSLWWISAASCL